MSVPPLHTRIEKTIELNAGLMLLESHSGFPRSESNLYLLSHADEILWRAEMPESGAHFTRMRLNDDGYTFAAYTVSGHLCELDLKTGKLLNASRIE